MNRSRRVFVGKALVATLSIIAIPLLTSVTLAGEDPIPLIDVVVERTPPGVNVGRMQTDRNGYLRFKSLSSGTYVISDKFGNRASVKHRGGPVNWRLIGSTKKGKPVWKLVDH